ncbi:MAG: DUF5043 domain-containing protein [Odoribacteraceae bacterium]|jgi:hypothetical protein|nr:DUF5043 domain-containing protein [Odoribacteraceae bacterium]
MKRKTILSVISCLLLAGSTGAQTINPNISYYTTTRVIEGNGYTYQCDIDEADRITLYNANNKFVYVKWGNKDGSPMEAGVSNGSIETTENDTWSRSKSKSIVDNAFSAEEKAWVKGQAIIVIMIIDSETGKVIEVNFEFLKNTPYQQIPLAVFRKIELELKREIWFKVTPAGKKLNYCMAFWLHEFN